MRTVLTTGDNKIELVPNGDIAASKITNYSTSENRRVDLKVTASYNDKTNDVKNAIIEKRSEIKAYVIGSNVKELNLELSNLTDDEREIILKGCLINYYKG